MNQGFDISVLQDASILTLNDMRERILISPEYQREGGVWTPYKKQLFIDSLINKYDVPKFYFHRMTGEFRNDDYDYSIIDGRQRLETIWGFLNDEFPLSDDFTFLEDPSIALRGAYFKEFAGINPRMSTRLYGRSLTVMLVQTDDIDFIEDMFTRLNEAVPLNAAEKRNSFGGPLPRITRELVNHIFFLDRTRVPPTRYRHHDLVAKMLWITQASPLLKTAPDTKKATLDSFYKGFKHKDEADLEAVRTLTEEVLDDMVAVFGQRDPLLKSPGVIPLYFLLFEQLRLSGESGKVTRQQLSDFEDEREGNRRLFREEADGVDFRLIEYDELAQSSNDAASITARLELLREHLDLGEFEYPGKHTA